jgi:hypothetical protein
MSEVIWQLTVEDHELYFLKNRLIVFSFVSIITAILLSASDIVNSIVAILGGLFLGFFIGLADLIRYGGTGSRIQRKSIVLTSNDLRVSSEGALWSFGENVYPLDQIHQNTIRVTSGILGAQLRFKSSVSIVEIDFPNKKTALDCHNRLISTLKVYKNKIHQTANAAVD